MNRRELTGRQRQAIRKLVTTMCANYNREYDCCPLLGDHDCYMLTVGYISDRYCRYFEKAVLPLNPALEQTLKLPAVRKATKLCSICGIPFPVAGRKLYCSERCCEQGRKVADAKRARRYRQNMRV